MTTQLPPSLSVSPNIPLEKQTLDELRQEYAYWDGKIRNATAWGAAIAVAYYFRSNCAAEIERREQEQAQP